MMSYTTQRNYFATIVNNAGDTATLVVADTLINDKRRTLLSSKNWWFLEKSFTINTIASTQTYALQGDIDRILSDPYVTVGTIRYTPKESPSVNHWNRLNLVTYSNDIPTWWRQYGSNFELFPKPSSSSNVITLNGKQKVIDMSIADYTTGTIVSVANGGTAVVGSGTTWTSGMIGMWIRITAGTGANLGDHQWYQISAVGSTTTLTLSRAYGGTAIVAGSASYTIGQMSILPDAYDSLPVYESLQTYFTSIDPDENKATQYGSMADSMKITMNADQSSRTGGRVLDGGIGEPSIINPNLTI